MNFDETYEFGGDRCPSLHLGGGVLEAVPESVHQAGGVEQHPRHEVVDFVGEVRGGGT
jgi:hypothetical protein